MSIIIDEKSNSSSSKIILRLGPFHTEMNFLGSIGHLMKGSGLEELFGADLLYGKAVPRA